MDFMIFPLCQVDILFWICAQIEAEDRMGRTPLCCATLAGNIHSMKALEKEGANVHHVDNAGWSLAHLAVSRGHIEALKLALQWVRARPIF